MYIKPRLNAKYGSKINDGTEYPTIKAVAVRGRNLESDFDIITERKKETPRAARINNYVALAANTSTILARTRYKAPVPA